MFVDNVEEHGKAVLHSEADDDMQPEVGKKLTASVDDPDGSVTIVTWQWSIAETDTDAAVFMPIDGETTNSYTPTKADESNYLRATATYLDSTSDEDDLTTADIDERVQVDGGTDEPQFKPVTPADPPGAASDMGGLYRVVVTSGHAVQASADDDDVLPTFAETLYMRSVFENAEEGSIVGLPVTAEYGGNLEYTLEQDTPDNRYFEIDANGQIRVGTVTFPTQIPTDIVGVPTGVTAPDMEDPALDYEAAKSTYGLKITATDPEKPDRVVTTRVRVALKNLNESPWFDKASRDDAAETKMYAENVGTPVYTLAARDPDGGALRWEVTGPDAADFRIMPNTADRGRFDTINLVFDSQPDFEDPSDRGLNLNPGDGTDQDNDFIDDGEFLPNDSMYQVTVRATEMSDSVGGGTAQYAELDVTVQVTNVDEPGSVALNWLKPEVGTPITATMTDPDAGNQTATWQWYRSKVSNPDANPNEVELERDWEEIDTATSATYTPQGVADDPETPGNERTLDVERFLLARAMYDNGDSPAEAQIANGMSAYAGVRYTVRADGSGCKQQLAGLQCRRHRPG